MSPQPDAHIQQHWSLSGRVQGVGYRAWLVTAATALNIKGWVRNRKDGTVEAVVAAPQSHISQLHREALRGPPGARVDTITVNDDDSGILVAHDFEWRATL
jgi:acylphosphatase